MPTDVLFILLFLPPFSLRYGTLLVRSVFGVSLTLTTVMLMVGFLRLCLWEALWLWLTCLLSTLYFLLTQPDCSDRHFIAFVFFKCVTGTSRHPAPCCSLIPVGIAKNMHVALIDRGVCRCACVSVCVCGYVHFHLYFSRCWDMNFLTPWYKKQAILTQLIHFATESWFCKYWLSIGKWWNHHTLCLCMCVCVGTSICQRLNAACRFS